MKKLLSGLISLIIFIAIGATGAGFYVNSKTKQMANEAIETLKISGFDLSSYESLDIDFFKQTASLKNLKIASSDQIWFRLNIGEFTLAGIDPISELAVSIKDSMAHDIDLTYYGQNYKIKRIHIDGLKSDYQPHFERMLVAPSLAEKIRLFHQELNYNSISFQEFVFADNLDNVSRVADGSYSKQALVNDLPSQWRAHLTGMEISPAHLSAEYRQLLQDYNLKELNGILDISMDYQQTSRTAVFAINNLNFGGLANLQADILTSMNEERFMNLYDIENLDKNINTLPIEHAEILYNDYGLYNHFVTQQAPMLGLTKAQLKSQIRFGLVLGSANITDLDRRLELTQPLVDFIEEPAELKIELSPAKPVRFQHYLNVYDANILIRDLNPTVAYTK